MRRLQYFSVRAFCAALAAATLLAGCEQYITSFVRNTWYSPSGALMVERCELWATGGRSSSTYVQNCSTSIDPMSVARQGQDTRAPTVAASP
jgi:hypothetical protein